MVKKRKGLGPVKRFGVRYGRTVKYKLANIEIQQKQKHKCPYCSRIKVSRIAAGIWHCAKCDAKFAARAYTVGQKVALAEKATDLVAEAPVLRSKKTMEEEEL